MQKTHAPIPLVHTVANTQTHDGQRLFTYLRTRAQRLLQACIRFLLAVCFNVRSKGWERLPSHGAVLMVGNHQSYTDAILLSAFSPRPVRMLGAAKLQKHAWMRLVFRLFKVIPVDANRPLEVIRAARDALNAGEVVAIFPEGTISPTGELQPLQKGCLLIAKQTHCHLLSFAFRYDQTVKMDLFLRPLAKRLDRLRTPRNAHLHIGAAINPTTATLAEVERAIRDAQAEILRAHPDAEKSLAEIAVRGLKRNFFAPQFVDLSAGRRELRSGMALALVLTFSKMWRKRLSEEQRIGVVLPSGLGSLLVNLSLQVMGKTPVNLNFTAGTAVNQKCLAKAGIKTVITAGSVREKLPDFPWPANIIDLAEEQKSIRKPVLFFNYLRAWLLPAQHLLATAEAARGGEREATILFSSGTTGDPKGVVLSHRNVVANLLQIESVGLLDRAETLLASLPAFHSFGFTVTLWYPLRSGMKVVSLPSPLETRRLGKAIFDEQVTVLMSTPTFLKPFLKRVPPEWMKSLNYVVVGAEKSPQGLAARWEETFGSEYLEGYGLTEAAPVVSCNLPTWGNQTSTRRHGTVGRFFAGVEGRIVHPESFAPCAPGETGLLELTGPNFFAGYLDDPEKTAQAFRDGWYATGDLARIDADGFLTIEGRLSRFSKMGGEMIPHGAIEEAVHQAFAFEDAGLPQVAVTGLRDDIKGEVLVLLTVSDISTVELRERLTAQGLPNLWIPKRIQLVDTIPVLGTGKLDLKKINQLAAASSL